MEVGQKVAGAHFPPPHRQLQATDLFALRPIGEAQISPEGSRVCFAQTVLVPEENTYRSHLWLVSAAGGESQPLTQGDQLDLAPATSGLSDVNGPRLTPGSVSLSPLFITAW